MKITPEQKRIVGQLASIVWQHVAADLYAPEVDEKDQRISNAAAIETVLDADRLEDEVARWKRPADVEALKAFRQLAVSTQHQIIRQQCGRFA